MLLTDAERKRFCEYLELQIASNKALMKQMTGVPRTVVLMYEAKVRAYETVLKDIRDVEVQTV